MSKVEELYKWLAGDLSPEVDRVLAAGLAHAEPPYAARLAAILVGRRRESAWAGLVANFDRLPADARSRVLEPPELLRAGIAAAMRSAAARSRGNALAVLLRCPVPQLAYLVSDALRDPAPENRRAAAAVLRGLAEHVLDRDDRAHGGASGSAEGRGGRAELVRALREALRTFDVHGQREVLEACLWLARDLGEALWEALAQPHSQCGHVVSQHLASWSGPRLAGFLLAALARPAWRRAALELLNGWHTRAELVALLRNTDLLADPGVRRGVHHLTHPRWFTASAAGLAALPPDARAKLPQWICCLGLSDAERLHYLSHWQASPLPELHRGAVYALASLGLPEAEELLMGVAARPCPMNQFARWHLAGRRVLAERGRDPHGPPSPRRVEQPAPIAPEAQA